MNKSLHIVSFDVPYPPNYGGIIDVFYKIKALHSLGIKIYLHTFIYNDRKKAEELNTYCEQIFYYKRKSSFNSLLSFLPFRLQSRINKDLNKNLKTANCPILFEGINTMYPLFKFNLKDSFVRTHNIEHTYFYGLSKSEKNFAKKLFYLLEGYKLKNFEKNLKKAKGIFTISPFEQDYFSRCYKNAHYIPAFHEAVKLKPTKENGNFILYHGDLRVSDNIKAVLFLIDIYKNTSYNFVIASSNPPEILIKKTKEFKNISIDKIPTQKDLDNLLAKAQIHTLITFQKTGIKLKLLNTLYKGKHIIANSEMIEDTGLESVCHLANTKSAILVKTEALFKKQFTTLETEQRENILQAFSPQKSAKKMIDIIFE
ncbi:MAG: hypothetical protein AB8B78_10470 [Polaribacter sp.]